MRATTAPGMMSTMSKIVSGLLFCCAALTLSGCQSDSPASTPPPSMTVDPAVEDAAAVHDLSTWLHAWRKPVDIKSICSGQTAAYTRYYAETATVAKECTTAMRDVIDFARSEHVPLPRPAQLQLVKRSDKAATVKAVPVNGATVRYQLIRTDDGWKVNADFQGETGRCPVIDACG